MNIPTRNLRTCQHCHADVITPAANLVYCDKCRTTMMPEIRRERSRRWYLATKGKLAHMRIMK